jgi:glycosyltransferase involved in cell wall biosynthesis
VRIIPMAIDPPAPGELGAPADGGPLELLWLGGKSTLRYLDAIAEPLGRLGRNRGDVVLRLVAHEQRNFTPLSTDFRPWSPQEQSAALRECHIGLCPMPDTVWTRGKCPYKVLQYMAWGMPWVGSAVGENAALGQGAGEPTGLLAASADDWPAQISRLLDEADLRRRLGQAGREYVETRRTRDRVADVLAGSLRELAGGGRGL